MVVCVTGLEPALSWAICLCCFLQGFQTLGNSPRFPTNTLPARHRIGGGCESLTPLNNYSFVAGRLVAAALLARDPATVVPFNRGSLHAAALSWADRDTTWADANCGVGIVPATVPIIAVVPVPSDLNIDALGHLDALGLGRSDQRGSRQHRCGCRHGKSDLHHVGVLLGLDLEVQRARTLRVPPRRAAIAVGHQVPSKSVSHDPRPLAGLGVVPVEHPNRDAVRAGSANLNRSISGVSA